MRIVNLVLKRIFDILLSFIAIILLFPIWIIMPVMIKADSKGPVLFKQRRRTKNGRVFNMLKYRSMVVNAESIGTGLFSYEDDPRITKVGRMLRETSIDEFPQLFNIFKGDMSIVGPRPPVEYELGDFDTLNKTFKKRFRMKAGLTGLAQVKGRNDIRWDEKVYYDNIYIDKFEKFGIIYDIMIIFETIASVFKKKNVYEAKMDSDMDDLESAQKAEAEVIRLAHIEEGDE